jgi:hypothetical protein
MLQARPREYLNRMDATRPLSMRRSVELFDAPLDADCLVGAV